MTHQSVEERLKFILSAPFLNGKMAEIPGEEVKQNLAWQMKELKALLSTQQARLKEAVEGLLVQRLEDLETEYLEGKEEHTATRMFEAKLLKDNLKSLLSPSKKELE